MKQTNLTRLCYNCAEAKLNTENNRSKRRLYLLSKQNSTVFFLCPKCPVFCFVHTYLISSLLSMQWKPGGNFVRSSGFPASLVRLPIAQRENAKERKKQHKKPAERVLFGITYKLSRKQIQIATAKEIKPKDSPYSTDTIILYSLRIDRLCKVTPTASELLR